LQKPDGLVVIQRDDLPHALHSLRLTDFTGINVRMAARLHAAGIFTAESLCAADRPTLLAAFGSVIGEKWWYLLRGYELTDDESERKSLSHSHVLAPELRNDEGCYQVLLRLIQKATARLRSQGLRAQTVTFYVSGFTAAWKASEHLPATDDAIAINQALARVWPARNYERPRGVGVVFADLVDAHHFTPSLFEDRQQPDRHRLMEAVDQVNEKFGKNTIYLAGMQRTRDAAPERIAFTKTWLFSEGKGDNEWVDTFRGARTADS
jgi:DNA polymerase-4